MHPQPQTHARRDCASGFSYVNDVVLAMLTLLRKYATSAEIHPRSPRDAPEMTPRLLRDCSEMNRLQSHDWPTEQQATATPASAPARVPHDWPAEQRWRALIVCSLLRRRFDRVMFVNIDGYHASGVEEAFYGTVNLPRYTNEFAEIHE